MRFDRWPQWTAGTGIVLFVIALFGFLILDNKYQEQRVFDWAEMHGYRVLEIQESVFDQSSPFPKKDDDSPIYKVRVRDKKGVIRNIWFHLGKVLDQRWDDENKRDTK